MALRPLRSVPAHVTRTDKSQPAPDPQLEDSDPQAPCSKASEPTAEVDESRLLLLYMQREGPHPAQLSSHAKLEIPPSRKFTTRFNSNATLPALAYTCGQDAEPDRSCTSPSLLQFNGSAGVGCAGVTHVYNGWVTLCVIRIPDPDNNNWAYSSTLTLNTILLIGRVDMNMHKVTVSPSAKGPSSLEPHKGGDQATPLVVGLGDVVELASVTCADSL